MTRALVVGQSHVALRLGAWVRKLSIDTCLAPLGQPSAALLAAWKGSTILQGERDDPDLLVQKRADVREGRRRYHLRNHVLMCGLGVAGLRVAECLKALGQRVLVIEKDGGNPLLSECAALGIPYMVADATRESALRNANLSAAKGLVSTLNDDLTSLEIGLAGRALCADLRVVLRLFEGSFAQRVERHFKIHTALSTSGLAAPAFLAKALWAEAHTLVDIGEETWVIRSLREGAQPHPEDRLLLEGAPPLVLTPMVRVACGGVKADK